MSTNIGGVGAGFADGECPIDLHYPDEHLVVLDYESMTRQGRRMRRHRKTALTGMAGAAIGIVGLATCAVPSSGGRPPSAAADAASAVSATVTGKDNPPVGQVAVLSAPNLNAHPAGQSVVAWATQDGEICIGSIDIAKPTDGPLLSCTPAPGGLLSSGPVLLPNKPTFRAGPILNGHVLAIGFVRGAASSVSVTMSGSTTTGAVVALGDNAAGAYAVWLPTGASSAVDWSMISKVAAKDSAGNVVATLP